VLGDGDDEVVVVASPPSALPTVSCCLTLAGDVEDFTPLVEQSLINACANILNIPPENFVVVISNDVPRLRNLLQNADTRADDNTMGIELVISVPVDSLPEAIADTVEAAVPSGDLDQEVAKQAKILLEDRDYAMDDGETRTVLGFHALGVETTITYPPPQPPPPPLPPPPLPPPSSPLPPGRPPTTLNAMSNPPPSASDSADGSATSSDSIPIIVVIAVLCGSIVLIAGVMLAWKLKKRNNTVIKSANDAHDEFTKAGKPSCSEATVWDDVEKLDKVA